MASIKKFGNNWRAEIYKTVQGVVHRPTAVFKTKAEAQAWAAQTEAEILSGQKGQVKAVTFGKLLERYALEESPKHKGEIWEKRLIKRLAALPIYSVKLANLTADDFAKWRNSRLKKVAESTVRREWILLSAAINVAIKEWKWLTKSPLDGVKRPKDSPPRDRLFSEQDIALLTHTLGVDGIPKTVTARVGYAMLFAIETGMRSGEIVRLEWKNIKGSVANIKDGKTASAKRQVPLTPEALRILSLLPKEADTCFNITDDQRDALFGKAKRKAGITGLHFHDTRANACTKLAKQIDILSLAKMIGHKNINQLQVYYRDSAEDIAKRLATS
jgi:integrase